MSKIVDARGLSCPQPVLMTMDAIVSGTNNEIQVIVDNEAARENVIRAAENKGYRVREILEEGAEARITILKG